MGLVGFNITPEMAITAFFFGLGVVTAILLYRFLKGLLSLRRRAEVAEINLTLQKLKDDNSQLSLPDLILRANEDNRKRDGNS